MLRGNKGSALQKVSLTKNSGLEEGVGARKDRARPGDGDKANKWFTTVVVVVTQEALGGSVSGRQVDAYCFPKVLHWGLECPPLFLS